MTAGKPEAWLTMESGDLIYKSVQSGLLISPFLERSVFIVHDGHDFRAGRVNIVRLMTALGATVHHIYQDFVAVCREKSPGLLITPDEPYELSGSTRQHIETGRMWWVRESELELAVSTDVDLVL